MKKSGLLIVATLLLLTQIACNNIAPYPIDDPLNAVPMDKVVGKWRYIEDSNSHFLTVRKAGPAHKNQYRMDFENKKDDLNISANDRLFFSNFYGQQIVNIADIDDATHKINGYYFMHVIRISPDFDTILLSELEDTTLYRTTTRYQVEQTVLRDLTIDRYWGDTGHLVRIKTTAVHK